MALDEILKDKVVLIKQKEMKIKKLSKDKEQALAPIKEQLKTISDGFDIQINAETSAITTLEDDVASME